MKGCENMYFNDEEADVDFQGEIYKIEEGEEG